VTPSDAPLPPLADIYRDKKILLTGGTGFVGKVYLSTLLKHYPEVGEVVVMIRAGDQRAAEDRFTREVIASPALDPLRDEHGMHLREWILSKVTVVRGDLSKELAGLDEAQLDELTRDLDMVMHCAGLVEFVPPLDKALSINVDGTLTALELCKRAGEGRAAFVHVSTCFVCGLRPGTHQEQLVLTDYPNRKHSDFEGFDAVNELRWARRMVARIRREELEDPSVQADLWEEAGGNKRRAKRLGDVRVRRRLVEAGLERARRWGWPNTYTYTKALAERIVEQKAEGLGPSVLVRPAVVESSLQYPFPGWNQGINTSAPLVWLTSQGQRYWPSTEDTYLDVIPVDLVTNALVTIGAAALVKQSRELYQLGTSDSNPLAMRRVVELAALAYRKHAERPGSGTIERFMRKHFEAISISPELYQKIGAPAKRKLAQSLHDVLERIPVPDERPRLANLLQRVKQTVKGTTRDLERVEQLLEIYLPFIASCPVIFRTDNARRLHGALTAEDQAKVPFVPTDFEWRHYWREVHVPGLERWAFPQLRLSVGSGPTQFERKFSTLSQLLEDRTRFGRSVCWRRLGPGGRVDARVTFEDAFSSARAAAGRLIQAGVAPADRVVLLSENSPYWALGYFGILAAGGTCAPLEAEIEAERAAHLVAASEAKVVLVSESCRQRLASDLAKLLPKGVRLLELEDVVEPRGKDEELPEPPQEQELAPRAPASLIYTSGTTGASKGVLISHEAFCTQVRALASLYSVGGDDRVLSVLPLHHCFEFSAGFLLPLYGGATVTYLTEVNAENVRMGLDEVKPTCMIGVPALFEAWHRRVRRQVRARGSQAEKAYKGLLAFHREFRNRTGVNVGQRLFKEIHDAFGGELRFAVSGGAALPREIALEFQGIGLDIYEGYGLTESAPVLCAHRPEEASKPGSVGRAIPGVQVQIRNPDGEGVGEIVASSPSLCLGYDKDPERTAATIVDGWLHTGDLGRLDDEGNLYVVGRLKDAIVDASGNTVHPDEVEDLYSGCEDVQELAVAGVAQKGDQHEVVAALVRAKRDVEGDSSEVEERIRSFFQQRSEALPYPKRVKVLRFTQRELPRTATRKVKRAEVAKLLQDLARKTERGRRKRKATSSGERFAQIFRDVAGIDPSLVTREANLTDDLGLDSIALAEVALALADAYERPAPESLAGAVTVGDLLGLVGAEGEGKRSVAPLGASARPIVMPGLVKSGVRSFLDGLHTVGYGSALDCKVVGRGNIPHHTNAIVVANHSSHLDVGLVRHALGEYGEHLVSAGARDYFFADTFRATYFENFTNVMPFDRVASVRESLGRFVDLLNQGKTVLIFPEGTRSVSGRMGAFKPGLGLVVQAAKVGVLPIYLSGTHESMPKGSWLPRRVPLEARIGKFLPGQTLLAKTADLGRRQQATQIVEIVRENLAALRDSRPFDVADWTCDVEPKGRRRRKRQDNGSGTPSEAPVSSGKREES